MTKLAFRNLVFEGGGVKGIAYGGALEQLQKLGMLDHLERVAGTSAGAINACALAMGYTATEVRKIIATTDFSSFQDGSTFLGNAIRMLNKFGWYKGDAFMDWIGEVIKEKTGTKDFSFGELNEAIKGGDKSFKYLYMVATNLSKQIPETFSHEKEEYKNLAIRKVVRMSMSLPVFFASYKNGDSIMVDGGVSYNYPINLFDQPEYVTNSANFLSVFGEKPLNLETLGFRLDSKDVIEYARRNWATPPEKIKNLKTYTIALLDFMMDMANKAHLQPDDWNRTVFIDTLDVRTSDFHLPDEKIKALEKSGSTAIASYLEWRLKRAPTPWNDHPII